MRLRLSTIYCCALRPRSQRRMLDLGLSATASQRRMLEFRVPGFRCSVLLCWNAMVAKQQVLAEWLCQPPDSIIVEAAICTT